MDYKHLSKIMRLPIGKTPQYVISSRKPIYSSSDMGVLLSGTILIEEKIDGKEQMYQIGEYIVFGEYMRIRHSIFYDNLPSDFIVYDVFWKKEGKWLSRLEKEIFCEANGYIAIQKLYEGTSLSVDEIIKRYIQHNVYSAYCTENNKTIIEGIVIKNYKSGMFGKIVRSEFIEGLEKAQHYSRQKRSTKERYNIVLIPK